MRQEELLRRWKLKKGKAEKIERIEKYSSETWR